jgi:hypothetical protein
MQDFGEGLGMGTASIIKNTMSVFSSVGGITNSVTKGISGMEYVYVYVYVCVCVCVCVFATLATHTSTSIFSTHTHTHTHTHTISPECRRRVHRIPQAS